eukprot:scaffold1272_cov250-Pinguiococcus_pyrenoidosus.AAC.14
MARDALRLEHSFPGAGIAEGHSTGIDFGYYPYSLLLAGCVPSISGQNDQLISSIPTPIGCLYRWSTPVGCSGESADQVAWKYWERIQPAARSTSSIRSLPQRNGPRNCIQVGPGRARAAVQQLLTIRVRLCETNLSAPQNAWGA